MNTSEFLPPLRSIGPIRVSRDRLDGHPAYASLLHEAASTGACPVWVTALNRVEPPDDPAAAIAAIPDVDPEEFLARHWTRNCPLCGCRDPFGTFPGLAPRTRSSPNPLETAESAVALQRGHLALVPAGRPADVITALGWTGPANYGADLTGLSAVLRSWEDRFGAVLVRVDAATLWLSVASPPRTPHHAERIAAEHFSFCRDVDWEDPRPLRTYAADLVGAHTWRFWWD
ncbi:DUF4253 domain-containing protein [Pseudonocardia sp. CA-107938]|uniref:DUF4253 domain-containing protein n=1 Tax=Pseudonocardia sp. CA-107938 TaxID=3240021 RepID=UPI003D8DED94